MLTEIDHAFDIVVGKSKKRALGTDFSAYANVCHEIFGEDMGFAAVGRKVKISPVYTDIVSAFFQNGLGNASHLNGNDSVVFNGFNRDLVLICPVETKLLACGQGYGNVVIFSVRRLP